VGLELPHFWLARRAGRHQLAESFLPKDPSFLGHPLQESAELGARPSRQRIQEVERWTRTFGRADGDHPKCLAVSKDDLIMFSQNLIPRNP